MTIRDYAVTFSATTLVTASRIAWTMASRSSRHGRHGHPLSRDASREHRTGARRCPAPAAQATGFVGDETCSTCHEPEGKGLHATLHGKAQNTRTPAAKTGQSCETCHGPGQAHVDTGDKAKIKRFNAMSARDVNATCLTCHSKGSHAQWNGGMHDARNVSCASCHSVHNAKSNGRQLKTGRRSDAKPATRRNDEGQEVGEQPVGGQDGLQQCIAARLDMCACSRWEHPHETCASCTPRSAGVVHDHAAAARAVQCHDQHARKRPDLVARSTLAARNVAAGSGDIYAGTQIAAASNRASDAARQLPFANPRVDPPRGRKVPR